MQHPLPFTRLRRLSAALVCTLTFALALPAAEKSPEATQALETQGLLRLLEEVHYNRDVVKPADYAELIAEYMHDLDGQRLFFLRSDLEHFQQKNPPETLYWNLTSLGRLTPAFDIADRYQERARKRADWIFKRLGGDFDLAGTDSYQFDRKESPWPSDEAEADALWEGRLKFELLQEILNHKPAVSTKTNVDETHPETAPLQSPEETQAKPSPDQTVPPQDSVARTDDADPMSAAKETVRKRYERLLKNLDDIEQADVSEMFLACVAHLYDPHSTYFSAGTFEDFSISMRLQLFGIGALLGIEDDLCVIKEIIPGGPADLDKQLKPNDKIVAVAQEGAEPVEIIGMKLRKIVEMIRGPKDTKVRLIIQPGDAADAATRRELTLTRDIVNLDSARAHGAVFELPVPDRKTRRIGVINLPTFYRRDSEDDAEQASASADVAEIIKRMKAQGDIDALVLDLRRNGGGLLNEAVDLTGLFIPSGPVVQVRSYFGDVKVDRDEDPRVAYDGPLVVLTSRFSASASEIVAGALQNYGRAVIVGDSSTHGKGTVQTVIEMKSILSALNRPGIKSGATKLTIQKFYLPNGESTQLRGVVPDIVLPSPDEYLPIGEASLPHAMVWDKISTSFYDGGPLSDASLTPLQEASRGRQDSLEEFAYLRKTIDWFRERQEEKSVSLNLEQRRQTKESDKAFRDKMDEERKKLEEHAYAHTEIWLSPPPPPRIKPPAEDGDADVDEAEEDEQGYAKLDIHLRESLRIAADLTPGVPAGELIADAQKAVAR